MIDKILDLIYPEKCPFCGTLVSREEEGICEACKSKLPYIGEPRCMMCGKPISSETEEFCYDCKKTRHIFDGGRNLWIHKESVRQAVYSFKYHDRKCYGKIFGREMAKKMSTYLNTIGAEALVPIPLHKKRYRDRGYNQAQVLASEIGRQINLPVEDILIRTKETNPQKMLSDIQRRKNIEGAFALKGECTYRTVVLVDDIYTTGSTLDEAAKVLKKAGASKVFFLTISIGQGF